MTVGASCVIIGAEPLFWEPSRNSGISQQTGMGKLAVYKPLPLAMDAYLAKESCPRNPPGLSAVLVISPLISVMEEQTRKLQRNF